MVRVFQKNRIIQVIYVWKSTRSKQTNERTEKDPIVDVCYGFSPMVGDFDQAAKNQKTSIFCSIRLNV